MSDLFDHSVQSQEAGAPGGAAAPLAHRMRPLGLEDLVGHERVLGPGRPLRGWIDADRVPSIVLWGPPGSGKTTLARIVAEKTRSSFSALSAVLSGVKDIKEAVERARDRRKFSGARTILFVDEIHRFNKSQQDALLPHVEEGVVTLIGATTENPSFALNSALLSRVRVIRLERIPAAAIEAVLRRALEDPERGLGGRLRISDEAVGWLAAFSEGDARRALTMLETVSLSAAGPDPVSVEDLQRLLEATSGSRVLPHDKAGEEHYNVISAYIKSLRDGDPHAALYYLARLLEAGEDAMFVARRMVIFASEDVGNADPRGLQLAVAAQQATHLIGMPEARIVLAQATTYLALAPKSNASYVGIAEAIAEVQASGALPVPMHLRNAATGLMKAEGYGAGYRYPHDQPAAPGKRQVHLPAELAGKRFYRPKDAGLEIQFKEKLARLDGASAADGE